MNGYQRIAAALAGEPPDCVPVMLHNFLMAAREAGVSMGEYRRDPEAVARVFLQAVETYGYDGIVLDIDTSTLAGAIGVPVDFPDDQPAGLRAPRLERLEDVDALEPPDVGAYWGVQVWLEAARILVRQCGGAYFIRGNCDQDPFSLAAATRSLENWMIDLTQEENHPRILRLLDYCTLATAQFVRLMAATGVHMVSNGDSPAGPDLISPHLYRQWAWPSEARIVAEAHACGLPYALHICGKTDRILEDMVRTGADALELDYKTDVRLARRVLAGRAVFIGNLDPTGVLAQGGSAEVESATRELLAVFAGNPRFILNAGCAIPAATPPENLRTMIRTAREWRG
jgi:uroporphyrinogen decarboxylase